MQFSSMQRRTDDGIPEPQLIVCVSCFAFCTRSCAMISWELNLLPKGYHSISIDSLTHSPRVDYYGQDGGVGQKKGRPSFREASKEQPQPVEEEVVFACIVWHRMWLRMGLANSKDADEEQEKDKGEMEENGVEFVLVKKLHGNLSSFIVSETAIAPLLPSVELLHLRVT